LHLVGILFPHIKDDARSESLQINMTFIRCRRKFISTWWNYASLLQL